MTDNSTSNNTSDGTSSNISTKSNASNSSLNNESFEGNPADYDMEKLREFLSNNRDEDGDSE
jgi:hypothetical protein